MEIRLDILDDRLEEGDGDDRERLRSYLARWRSGEIDPLDDGGVVVIVGFGGGLGPRLTPLVVNDGEGAGSPAAGVGRDMAQADQ